MLMLLVHFFNSFAKITYCMSRLDYFRILLEIVLLDQWLLLTVVIGIDVLRIKHRVCKIHSCSFHVSKPVAFVMYIIPQFFLIKTPLNGQKMALCLRNLYEKYCCIKLSNSNCTSSNAFCTTIFDLSVCSTKAANCFWSSSGGTSI